MAPPHVSPNNAFSGIFKRVSERTGGSFKSVIWILTVTEAVSGDNHVPHVAPASTLLQIASVVQEVVEIGKEHLAFGDATKTSLSATTTVTSYPFTRVSSSS